MAGTIPCPSCGKPVASGDRFCPACGTAVSLPEATAIVDGGHDLGTNPTQCVKCGSPMGREDAFCSNCGAARPEAATVVSHVSLRNTQAAHLIEATRGEFEIVRQLGTGAMGAVYLAKDTALGRHVAIKVIAPNLLSDGTMVSRFRLEAQTVAALRHPNIVNVHAVRQSDDLHFFVMEFIDGPPLRSIVKANAPLDVDVVQSITFQVGSALSYAHRTRGGVIHRDVKPANIMIDREGDAFVTDFGISKIAESHTGLTQTGATIGTPEYMSPEQCRGESLTGASDQYALGIVAYEMLCGRTPFSGSQYFIMVAHTSEPPKPIRELRPDCPVQVAEAVERMLAKSPAERWPDLDAAVLAMGGTPLGYHDPVRKKIQALTGATLASVPTVSTGPPSAPVSGGADVADTATSVTVTGLPSRLETGERFHLHADVRSGDASLAGVPVVWASTDPSIARVDGDFVEALRPGSVSITASAGNVASSVLLTVSEPAPAQVLVRPATVTMHEGGRITLRARVDDKRGQEMPKEVRWASSDGAVATVSQEGEVVATGLGGVTITAESEGVTGSAKILVEAPVAEPVPPKPAAPRPAPRRAPAPPAPTAPAAARRPLYRRPGPIVVAVALLLGVSLVGILDFGGPGGEDASTLGTFPGDNVLGGPSDNGPSVASEPVPTGVAGSGGGVAAPEAPPASGGGGAPPAARPDATASGPEPEPSRSEPTEDRPTTSTAAAPAGRPPATTRPPPASAAVPARVAISIPTSSMAPGGSQVAAAQVFASGGDRLASGSYSLAWRSSDPGVVTVNARTGAVRAGDEGTAWLVATAGRASDSLRVVVRAVVASVEITGGDFALAVGGAARALTAVAADGRGQSLGRTVTWSSSDDGVARVDESGRVTPVGPGSARITAAADGVSDRVTVSVTAAAAAPAPEPVAAAAPTPQTVRAAVDGYVAALAGGDRDAVTRLWGSGPPDALSNLLELMGQPGFRATLASVDEATAEGDAVIVPFEVATAYRTSFGQNRERSFGFVGRLERTGGEWRLTSSVVR